MFTTIGPIVLIVVGSDAFWGFIGGVGYAGTRLATALWGGREITARARKLAIAQFVLSMMLAPAAAHALTPLALSMMTRATHTATALFIGLTFNAAWPLLIKPAFIRQLVADIFRGLAARIAPTGENP